MFGSVLLVSHPAFARARDPWKHVLGSDAAAAPAVHFEQPLSAPAGVDASVAPAAFTFREASTQTAAPAPAFEYSDAYKTRAKIHKVASFATLPLFATEVVLGQKTYDDPSGGTKSAHVAIGATIGALFAVNTVTGVWNLVESRKDPTGRGRRLLHGILMLAADAGFLATAAVAPDSRDPDYADQRGTHRAVALTSIGIATAGYLVQIIGG
jgi:hypothetical protein